MLTKLYIKNFQAHEDSYLELHPGVNVITGENDTGKSSIVRFIRWMAMNRPLGESIIRDGQTEVQGTMVVMNDGQEIPVTRIRNRSKNVYTLDSPETTFEAFGSDPPEHIQSILRLTDLNYQDQFDPYFLVTQSPGQSAIFIRYHTDLDVLDKAIAVATSKLSKIKVQITQSKTEEMKIQASLDNLCTLQLGQFQFQLEQATEKNQRLAALSNQIQKISALVTHYERCASQLSRYSPNIDQAYTKATKVLADLIAIHTQKTGLADITSKFQCLQVTQLDLHTLEDLVKLVTEVRGLYQEQIIAIQPLSATLSKWDKLRIPLRILSTEECSRLTEQIYPISVQCVALPELIRKLQQHIKNHDRLDVQFCDMQSRIKQQEQIRDTLLAKVVTCPSCGQSLVEGGREHLLNHCA